MMVCGIRHPSGTHHLSCCLSCSRLAFLLLTLSFHPLPRNNHSHTCSCGSYEDETNGCVYADGFPGSVMLQGAPQDSATARLP